MLLARYMNWNRPCSALWRRLRLQRVKMRNDAIAGRAGIFCAGASGVGVRGPWRVSLASGERSGQEDEESLLRGKLEWKSRRRGSAGAAGTKPSERSFSEVKRA